MKLIIAGGRDFTDDLLMETTSQNHSLMEAVTEVVCGMARGADTVGYNWAKENNIPIKKFFANWDQLGKKAGYLRNVEMGEYADALLAFWDGHSKGTRHMIDIMKRLKKPYLVISYDGKIIEWEDK